MLRAVRRVRQVWLLTATLVLCTLFLGASAAAAQEPIPFNHRGDPYQAQRVRVANHQKIKISIRNTCPADFDYSIQGLGPAAPTAVRAFGKPLLETVGVGEVEADETYSGFVVLATKKADAKDTCFASAESKEPVHLTNAAFFLITDIEGWELAFSGSFTFSRLRNQQFALVPGPNGAGKVIRREKDKEDKVTLGLAAMTDLFHTRQPRWALSFGLGIREDNRAQYFVGLGHRFGERATLHIGVTAGSVDRLPLGIGDGSVVTDDNILKNLGQYTDVRPFVALSYSFLGSQDRMKAPFGEVKAK